MRAIDVGYGVAVLVEAEGAAVLLDTGPAAASARLRAALPGRLALVALSHPHPDHAGGLDALRDVAVERLVHNPDPAWAGLPLARLARQVGEVKAGATLEVGALEVRVLWPSDEALPAEDPNHRSLVLLVSWRGRHLLFPGDLVDVQAQASLCHELPARLDVLVLPHHGDATAGCLLDRAEAVVLSVGPNDIGVPRQPTLARAGARLRRTDAGGDVVIRLQAGER